MTVSENLVAALSNSGVKQVFGITGDAINYVVKAISQHPEMEWVPMRHEGNAAFAAFAQGELSGLGVCAGTVGPGSLHLINGLYNAKKERSPVIVISGQVETCKRGRDFFQEVDLQKAFDEVCEYQAIIREPSEAGYLIQRAIHTALSRRCVCRIEVARDLANVATDGLKQTSAIPNFDLSPIQEELQKTVYWLNRLGRVTILAGAGCREAREEVLILAQKLKAPIVHTLRSADIFDHEAEAVVGLTGLIGIPSAYKAIMNCELLLMLGTDFPYDEYLPDNVKTIQVDIRMENIGNRLPVDIGLQANVKTTVQKINELVQPKGPSKFYEQHTQAFNEWKSSAIDQFMDEKAEKLLHPQTIAAQLNEIAADDAIFVLETSTAAIWAARHISFSKNRRLIGSFNHGSMAVGLPAAIGAQKAFPGREVWALSGDGGFGMSMQDLITASNESLPVKVIVFNNASLQLIDLEMENEGEKPDLKATHLNNPDFAAYARLCGGEGEQVAGAAESGPALKRAKASSSPFVLNALVSSGEIPMPPHLSVKDALTLTKTKLKQTFAGIKGQKSQFEYMKSQLEAMIR